MQGQDVQERECLRSITVDEVSDAVLDAWAPQGAG